MEFKCNICENNIGFYITTNTSYVDKGISKELNLSVLQYRQILINNYNAFQVLASENRYETYFKNINDIQNAIEWIESVYISKNLLF